MTGNTKKAEKYSKKLERYRRKNSYYMIELSKQEIENGNYSKALRWAKKGIKKHSEEHEFYFVAAKAYAYLGDVKDSPTTWQLSQGNAFTAITEAIKLVMRNKSHILLLCTLKHNFSFLSFHWP